MYPADFADADTLTCTLAAMLYRQLQKSADPVRSKALNEFGLVIRWEERSAAVRNFWEAAMLEALKSMGIIGDSVRDLHVYNRPAALELQDGEAVIQ